FSRLLVHDPEPTQIYTLSLHDALPISGITRGIPLSNTNQLWGLAWGILVWGELRTAGGSVLTKVIGGSLVMAAGAAVIAFSSVRDRKSTRLNSSHLGISYAVFCLKKKK